MGLEEVYNPPPTHRIRFIYWHTFPHHMRFYSNNREGIREVKVQHKHYCKDPWGSETGTKALRSIPNRMERPDFAIVYAADERELRALDGFIGYKERCI